MGSRISGPILWCSDRVCLLDVSRHELRCADEGTNGGKVRVWRPLTATGSGCRGGEFGQAGAQDPVVCQVRNFAVSSPRLQ